MAAATSSYLDKVFRPPEYIWEAGSANLARITSNLEGHQAQRLHWLADSSTESQPPDPTTSTPLSLQQPQANAPLSSHDSTVNEGAANPGATRNAVVPLLSLVWNNAEPQNYQAQFGIGTDPLPFLLDLDTGSSLLWVQARLTDDDPAIFDQNQYDPKHSTTSQDSQETRNANYGDGDAVQAAMYTDNVHVQTLVATEQPIGAVKSAVLSAQATEAKSNGLIGLGLHNDGSGLVQNLQQQGAIRYASISLVGPRNDPSRAAEIDAKHFMEPRGHLIIGSVDEQYYTGQIAWCPQVSNLAATMADRWIVKLDAVHLNEKVVFQDQYALIDTGTTYIQTSPENFAAFRKAIGKEARRTTDYMLSYVKGSIKSVSFVFAGREIQLQPQDISLGDLKPHLEENLKPPSERVIRSLSSICTAAETDWPFSQNFWVLGGIFIDNVVTIFDFAERKVGFADISERDLAQDSVKP